MFLLSLQGHNLYDLNLKLVALKVTNSPLAFITKYIYVLEQLELEVGFLYRLLQKISIIKLYLCVCMMCF